MPVSGSATRRVERYGDLIGASAAMQAVFSILTKLEPSLANVLILGESGTGKELCARAIHDRSPVKHGPFVAVNCGCLDRNLARSELFGHERGAFTGALEKRPGCFAQADGGTLFLDEISELSLDVQPLLLRALESRRVTPIGGHGELPVRVRLIAASNRELSAAVASGTFRADLYYRIQVLRVELPPLRRREADVRAIALAMAGDALPESVLAALCKHDWPGNVRELRNAVEAFLALGTLELHSRPERSSLDECLEAFVTHEVPYVRQKEELVERFTRAYLACVLKAASGNRSEAARLAGLERSYLSKLCTRVSLDSAG